MSRDATERFDRHSLCQSAPVVALWPGADASHLAAGDRLAFDSLSAALADLFGNHDLSVTAILAKHQVSKGKLYHTAPRCLKKHPDGRIYGFRAALPYMHIKEYERQAPAIVKPYEQAGCAGMFGQLLRQYPSLEKLIRGLVRRRSKPVVVGGQVRQPISDIHVQFIEKCRQLGIAETSYPFNVKRLAFRALQAFVHDLSLEDFDMAVAHAGGTKSGAAAHSEEQAPAATRAFEVVEFDGHKMDLRLTVTLIDPFGMERTLELHRIWILVLLDVFSRAVIGYHIALGKEYNKDDVAAALQCALTPAVARTYQIPDMCVKEGGGFPSQHIVETEFACWDWFRMDGAKSHLADDTLSRLNQIVGCWTDNGPPASPNARPYIERFFHVIARHFAHRLPGTVGSDPESIEKALSDPGGKIHLTLELTELEDMVHVVLSNYNGTAHKGTGARTPLEAMAYSVRSSPGFLRTLPTPIRSNLCLMQEARIATIKGSTFKGVRPHVNFAHVRYSSPVLSTNAALIGRKVRIYYDVRDVRAIKAFFEDGSELGVLTATRPWNITPHSLRVRQEIHRLLAERKLRVGPEDCPIGAWTRMKWKECRTSKRAVNALAKANVKAPAPAAVEASLPAQQNARTNGVSEEVNAVNQPAPDNAVVVPTPMQIRRTIIF